MTAWPDSGTIPLDPRSSVAAALAGATFTPTPSSTRGGEGARPDSSAVQLWWVQTPPGCSYQRFGGPAGAVMVVGRRSGCSSGTDSRPRGAGLPHSAHLHIGQQVPVSQQDNHVRDAASARRTLIFRLKSCP